MSWLCVSQVQAAELVSFAVGMVRDRVLTSREVQTQNLLELALGDTPEKGRLKALSVDSKAFAKAVQDALLESVVSMEAQNFNLIQIPPGEVKAAEKRVLRILKDVPAWTVLRVTPAELERALLRKIQSRKFIQFRSDSSVLPVTDTEAQRYFSENRLKFGDLPFEKFRENIKAFLSKNQVEKRLKDWFDVLLSKYQVKNLIAEI